MSDKVVLEEEIRVVGMPKSVAALEGFARAASRVSERLSEVGRLAGTIAGIGGLFVIGESVREADQLFRAVGRVSAMTGMAADHAHAMFEMFQRSGIEAEGAERVMVSLTRLSGKLGEGAAESAEQAQKLQSIMTRIGVGIKAGPEERLLAMSKAAAAGKLKINDLVAAFNIPRSQASAMFSMLKGGPERLQEIQREVLGSAGVIDEKSLQTYKKMLETRRELSASWNDIVRILYKSLMPGVTVLLGIVRDMMRAIAPVVEGIADGLQRFAPAIKAALATLLAFKAASGAMGLFGAAGKAPGAMGLMSGLMRGGANAIAMRPLPLIGAGSQFGNALGMLGGSGSTLVRILSTVVGRFAVIGIVITVVVAILYKAFELIKKNTFGIADTLKKLFADLMTMVRKLWEAIQPIVNQIVEMFEVVVAGAAYTLVGALKVIAVWFDILVVAINKTVDAVQYLVNKVNGWLPSGWSVGDLTPIGVMKKMDNYVRGFDVSTAAVGKVADKTKEGQNHPGNNPDFRGSRFEITQNFATGFDPNRVAVTFKEDLIRRGEKRLDSGLRPVYSYR